MHWCYVFNDLSLIHEYGIDIPVCDDKIEGLYVPKEQACDLVDYVQVKMFCFIILDIWRFDTNEP